MFVLSTTSYKFYYMKLHSNICKDTVNYWLLMLINSVLCYFCYIIPILIFEQYRIDADKNMRIEK